MYASRICSSRQQLSSESTPEGQRTLYLHWINEYACSISISWIKRVLFCSHYDALYTQKKYAHCLNLCCTNVLLTEIRVTDLSIHILLSNISCHKQFTIVGNSISPLLLKCVFLFLLLQVRPSGLFTFRLHFIFSLLFTVSHAYLC
jgi:hypothetical protein